MSKSTVMKRTSKLSFFAGAFVVLGLVADARPAFAGESCREIDADGVGQNNGDFTTDAVITGESLLRGTTHTVFSPTGFDGTRVSFTGLVTFTTKKGTLDVVLLGSVDVTTGAFKAVGTDMEGTGKLAGADGTITLEGVEDLATGRFTETVTGELCFDRGKKR